MNKHDRMAVAILFAVVAGGILYLRQISPDEREKESVVASTQDFTRPPSVPFPNAEHILASGSAGGWTSVDFVSDGEPLEEAQLCVRSRRQAAAVSCYAFASPEDYAAAKASAAGSFEETCYEARWRRNKNGSENGGVNKFKTSGCPVTKSSVAEHATDSRREAERSTVRTEEEILAYEQAGGPPSRSLVNSFRVRLNSIARQCGWTRRQASDKLLRMYQILRNEGKQVQLLDLAVGLDRAKEGVAMDCHQLLATLAAML